MTKYTKSAMIFTMAATILGVVAVLINLIIPVIEGSATNINIFTIIITVVWIITILSSHGLVKRIVSSADGVTTYDTVLPIFPLTVIRLIEFAWLFLRHRSEFRARVFIIDVGLDVLLVVILLLDKSHYYYEAREEGEEDD